MKLKTRTLIALPVLCCMLILACSALTTLEAIIDTVASAVPILQASGVPIPPVVTTYLTGVSTCISAQNGSTAPTDTQLLQIASCLSTQIAPTLPPGIDQAIVNIINLVATDVIKFLAQHPAPITPATAHAVHGHALSAGDVAKLNQIKQKAANTTSQLQALAHKP